MPKTSFTKFIIHKKPGLVTLGQFLKKFITLGYPSSNNSAAHDGGCVH